MNSVNVIRRAEKILGYGITDVSGEREYPVIDGVVYADLFTGTPTIDGYTGNTKLTFNGSQATPYKNQIALDPKRCKQTVKITATWGSQVFLSEIDELLQWLEENNFTDAADEAGIRSKKIEDFSVTYRDAEEVQSSTYDTIRAAWSFYIRSVILISVTPEQKHDYRYF